MQPTTNLDGLLSACLFTDFVFPDNSVFDDLENDFDSLFLAQVKQDLLVTVRKLVKGNLHDTQEAPESDVMLQAMILLKSLITKSICYLYRESNRQCLKISLRCTETHICFPNAWLGTVHHSIIVV